jgi:hypothetical protein
VGSGLPNLALGGCSQYGTADHPPAQPWTRAHDEVTELVNRVYAAAKEGLWVEGAPRTTTTEIADMVAASQIAMARIDLAGS